MNSVIIMGTLAKIRQLSETKNGTPALTAHLRVPLESDRRNTDTVVGLATYGKTAVTTAALREGTTVIVEGSLVAFRPDPLLPERFEVRVRRLTVVKPSVQRQDVD